MPLSEERIEEGTLTNRRLRRSIIPIEEEIIQLTPTLRDRLQYSHRWDTYQVANTTRRQEMLIQISHPMYSTPYESKPSAISNKIILYEDSTKIVRKEDVILIGPIGYFMKDDKRLYKDYINSEHFIILDDKYNKYYRKIFTGINDDGSLICNNTYTSFNTSKYPRILNNDKTNHPHYFEPILLNNLIFNSKYEENLDDGKGIFYPKSILSKFQKNDKIGYRKYKGITGSFLQSIKNLPNTYISTLGKKYQYGVEIETISGILPTYLDEQLYYSAVHDGSLRHEDGNTYGAEYVTDILQGDLGLKQLKKLCYELTKRCLIDKKCGEVIATL